MPALSPTELDTLRQSPHYTRRFLSVVPRNVLATGVVTTVYTDSVSGAVYKLDFTLTDGTIADERLNGATIAVGTEEGGNNVGLLRFRQRAGLETVAVQEVSAGDCPVIIGNHLTFYEEHLLWPRQPRLVATSSPGSTYKDTFTEYHDYDNLMYARNSYPFYINVTDGTNSKRSPKFSGWEDTPGLGYREVTLSSEESKFWNGADFSAFTLPPGFPTHIWMVADCVVTAGGGVEDDFVTIRVPVGFRYVTLYRATAGYGYNWKQIPLWTHDENYPPITNFSVTQDTRTENGREMTLDFTPTDNDPMPVFFLQPSVGYYWEETSMGGDEPPEFYIDHFYGWIPKQNIDLKKYGGKYSVSLLSSSNILQQFRGFSQTITDAPVVSWSTMLEANVDKIIAYILHSYTTADQLINFWPGETDIRINGDEIQKSDIWSQITSAARTDMYSRAVTDSDGAVWVRRHPSYMPQGERDLIPVVMTIGAQDIPDSNPPKFEANVMQKVGEVRGEGGSYTGSVVGAYLSIAPGKAFGYANGSESLDFQRVPSVGGQEFVDAMTGYHYARVNKAIKFEVELVGAYDVFEVARGELVTLDWQEDNKIGLGILATCVVEQVSVSHEGSTKKVSVTLESLTDGAPGTMLEIPVSSPPPYWQPGIGIFPVFPDFPGYDWGLDWGLGSNVQQMAAFMRADANSEGGLAITSNFGNDALTTWTVYDWRTILGIGAGDFGTWCAAPDAFSYTEGSDRYAWLLWHLDGAIYISYINASSGLLVDSFNTGLVAEYQDVDSLTQAGMDASFGTRNHVVAVIGIKGEGTYAVYTDGTSPTAFAVSTIDTEVSTGEGNSAVWVSSKSPGRVYAVGYDTPTVSVVYKSESYGATWAEVADPSIDGAERADAIVSPHDDTRNPSAGIFFSFDSNGLARSTVSGDYDLIAPASETYMRSNRNVLAFAPGDCRILMYRSYDGFDQPSFSSNAIYKTVDALGSSPSFSTMPGLEAFDVWSLAFSGDNPQVIYGWGGPYHTDYNWEHDIIMSLDGGVTAASQLGDIAGMGYSAHILMGLD